VCEFIILIFVISPLPILTFKILGIHLVDLHIRISCTLANSIIDK